MTARKQRAKRRAGERDIPLGVTPLGQTSGSHLWVRFLGQTSSEDPPLARPLLLTAHSVYELIMGEPTDEQHAAVIQSPFTHMRVRRIFYT